MFEIVNQQEIDERGTITGCSELCHPFASKRQSPTIQQLPEHSIKNSSLAP